MAKTACEEAAEALEMRNFPPALPKRLRSEARELKRLRKAVVAHSSARTGDERYAAQAVIDREAVRIQNQPEGANRERS